MAIKVSGSGTALPLVQKLAEAFGKRHPEIRFDFDAGTNTGGGIKGVSAGVFHLAVANRSLSEAESALGLLYRPFGKDPLVFATHEGSGVTAMSSEQIRAVYAGDRTSWDQVGGPKQAIVLLDRDADETARKFGLVPFMMGQSVQAQTIVLTRSKEMADALSSTAHSLGYSTLGHLSSTQVQGVRAISLDGIPPAYNTVANGSYPLYLTLGLVHKPEPMPEVVRFIDFVGGPEGRALLESYNVAPY